MTIFCDDDQKGAIPDSPGYESSEMCVNTTFVASRPNFLILKFITEFSLSFS